MMNLLILGATGRTGVYGYNYALKQGHHVTVLVRTAKSLSPQDNLTIVEGSTLSEADMDKAFAASAKPVDAVAVFLNSRRTSDNPWAKFVGPERLIADSVANAARALRAQQQKRPLATNDKPRLVVMNARGSASSSATTPLIFSLLINYSNIKETYKDHDAVNAEIEEICGNEVSWTVVMAVGLSDSGIKPVKTFADTEAGAGWMITRESCARWMVDVATDRTTSGDKKGSEFWDKRVIVSN